MLCKNNEKVLYLFYMLIKLFPQLGNNSIIKYIKKGFESKHSAILIAALTLLSNLFSWEIPVMYAFAAIVAIVCLFGEDLRSLICMALCGYFLFSKVNNPLDKAHTSIFLNIEGIANLIIAASIVSVFAIGRLIFDLITNKERRKFPNLTWGFVALGASFLLGGLFSKYSSLNTVVFGLVEIFALSIFYFFFYFTVDFKNIEKSYFAYLMTVVGFLLFFEVLGILYDSGFFSAEGNFKLNGVYTGWGINNNIAGALIMCLPAPFYYAATKKNSWVYILIGNFFFILFFFIHSRGGILFGSFVYVLCIILVIWKSKKKFPIILTELFVLLCGVLFTIAFKENIEIITASLIKLGLNDSGRFNIYRNGLKQFLEFPVFGNGFYACEAYRWGDNSIGNFLPARYHNTFVQLLASGGMVAFIAYIFHRLQTLAMLLKKRSIEKYFIGLCVLGLLLTSLLDCHFFNFGPGLTYAILLLFLEIDHLREPPTSPFLSANAGNIIQVKLYNFK